MDTAHPLNAADTRVASGETELPSAVAAAVPPGRILEVDALRGLAAVSVVLWHTALIFPSVQANTRDQGMTLLNIAKYSPLHAVFAGPQAVLIFFLLSGFVLALPYLGPRAPSYRVFAIRRITRIWPPYAVSCLIAFALASTLGGERIKALSPWFNEKWRTEPSFELIAQHLGLVGQFPSNEYNPVLWSLTHEMRISLVFPLLIALTALTSSWRTLAASLAFVAVAVQLASPSDGAGDFRVTPTYVGFFAVGILIARRRLDIGEWLTAQTPWRRILLAVAALLFYTYSAWMPDVNGAHRYTFDLVTALLGSAGFLILALSSARGGRFLRTRVLQFLGRISYSLYLMHALVLLALVHELYGRLPTAVILALVWFVVILVAALGEIYIERPAVRLGRMLSRRMT